MGSMNVVRLIAWDYTCADGCCDDYGTRLVVNGEEITKYFSPENGNFASDIAALLQKVGAQDTQVIPEDERT